MCFRIYNWKDGFARFRLEYTFVDLVSGCEMDLV